MYGPVIFAFIVRNLRWLAGVPGASQIFDAVLLSSTALFSRTRPRAISVVEKRERLLLEMNLRVPRYGGIGFFFLWRGTE